MPNQIFWELNKALTCVCRKTFSDGDGATLSGRLQHGYVASSSHERYRSSTAATPAFFLDRHCQAEEDSGLGKGRNKFLFEKPILGDNCTERNWEANARDTKE